MIDIIQNTIEIPDTFFKRKIKKILHELLAFDLVFSYEMRYLTHTHTHTHSDFFILLGRGIRIGRQPHYKGTTVERSCIWNFLYYAITLALRI